LGLAFETSILILELIDILCLFCEWNEALNLRFKSIHLVHDWRAVSARIESEILKTNTPTENKPLSECDMFTK
jgi:hypothetical protein